jgi:hypothetical protein
LARYGVMGPKGGLRALWTRARVNLEAAFRGNRGLRGMGQVADGDPKAAFCRVGVYAEAETGCRTGPQEGPAGPPGAGASESPKGLFSEPGAAAPGGDRSPNGT